MLTSSLAWAQATAQLNGRVTDESAAALPGATITVTQTDTAFTRTVVTDETGTYVLPNLPIGPYRLEVSLQGFRSYIQTGLVLQVDASPTINAVLAVGGVEESITVEAAAPLIDTVSAGLSEVVQNEEVVALPLNGRNVADLIALAGGAVQTGTAATRAMNGGVAYSVAGGQQYGVAYQLDGATHNNPQDNLNLPFPFPDALQEFSVSTSGLSANQGMHAGASVNAVTRSGTNRFAGNAFEFVRDKRFNATSPFAGVGPDGRRQEDGLLRNQFGGTFGGPVVRDRLFFFGGYQGTALRLTPASNIAYVPTPAMLAGDFTALASPACNSGRQVALRAPFVNNRVDPSLLSKAALNVIGRLPATTPDPCGKITYSDSDDENAWQSVGRMDYQLTAGHSVFGRYMATVHKEDPAYRVTGNLLNTSNPGGDKTAQSLALGDTQVFGANAVHSLRFAFNRTAITRVQEPFFDATDLGIDFYSYMPNEMVLTITDGFNVGGGTSTSAKYDTNSYQLSQDLTLVRGSHQLGLGTNVTYWKSLQTSHQRSGGNWSFDGSITGLGLADFMLGRLAQLEHGGPGGANMTQWYVGLFAQDAWRVSRSVTVNAGVRWEPFFGQHLINGEISNFSLEGFRAGTKSTVFLNAPPGFTYPGDSGFPEGTSGINKQWWNFSPRIGVAWDLTGDGRTALRSSYSLAYDFPIGEYHTINVTSPPFGNRVLLANPPGGFDNPYGHVGGNPHPIVTSPTTVYPVDGIFGVLDPDINSPRVQTWNLAIERQVGDAWSVSAAYLGSYSDRLWGLKALNPGIFMGVGPCTLMTYTGPRDFPVCTTGATLSFRRQLFLENPQQGQFIGALDGHTDVGTQNYRGLKLSFQRRAANGLSINGNYTLGRCWGVPTVTGFSQISQGFNKPDDPDYDAGHCAQDRTHLSNITMGYVTPQLDNAALRALASDWRLSGVLSMRSGQWLNIVVSGDPAGTGIHRQATGQRPNRVSDDVYGEKTLETYLNRAAWVAPAPGTFGDEIYRNVQGPGFWEINLAVSRLLRFAATQNLELRVEAFNLLNNFNWGDPQVNHSSPLFGRITTQTGAPRVMQFGIKYAF